MNWEAAGTIGEIVSSIAVVISLVYVSLQIRHANKQSEIDSLRHTWDGLNQICDRMSESKETASIINRGRNALGSLDDDERLIFEHIHLRLLNTLESWYLQVIQTSRPGPYQESQIANLEGIVAGYFDYPGSRDLWDDLRTYFDPIADIVDSKLSSGAD
ncbi:MAG: hypothetical protein OEV34_15230 [Gammaproteobacteria bacterium]|nr:hypothetical protein [Gammaproteobacteria bacterium]